METTRTRPAKNTSPAAKIKAKDTPKRTKRETILDRLKPLPTHFHTKDVLLGDESLRLTFNNITNTLKAEGELRNEGYGNWLKTDKFGTLSLWTKKGRIVPVYTPERLEKLAMAAKLPRHSKEPTSIIKILTAIKNGPSGFVVSELAKAESVSYPMAKEVVRVLGVLGELTNDNGRKNSEWFKTGKFGTTEIWGILTDPDKVKFTRIRDALNPPKTPRKKAQSKP